MSIFNLRKWNNSIFVLLAAFVLLVGLTAVPQETEAHAKMTQAEPTADSVVSESPEYVRIAFNQSVNAGFTIIVADANGNKVTDNAPERSEDGKVLTLALPDLANGVYTVDYRVVSTDGHTVSGSYNFTVEVPDEGEVGEPGSTDGGADGGGVTGDDGSPNGDGANQDDHASHEGDPADDGSADHDHADHDHGDDAGHDGTEDHDHDGHEDHMPGTVNEQQPLTPAEAALKSLMHLSRILFYIVLLSVTGWVGWMAYFRRNNQSFRPRNWEVGLLRAFLLASIAYLFFGYGDWIGYQWNDANIDALLSNATGWAWVLTLALAILAFVILFKNPILDLLWAVALIVVNSIDGHAAAMEPLAVSRLLDFVHFAAASLWAGGLLLLVVMLTKDRPTAYKFTPRFSGAALWSIIVLAFTGFAMTWIYLPLPTDIFLTLWGWLLLAKVTLTLLVAIIAYAIRGQLKRSGSMPQTMLRVDLGAMLVIVAIVGILTYANPGPPAEPFHWHVMGNEIHMTAEVNPNEPGKNEFVVEVWLPEAQGNAQSVELKLTPPADGAQPINIPLVPAPDTRAIPMEFPGFIYYRYTGEGRYINERGSWTVHVRVVDANGKEFTFEQQNSL